MKKKFKTKESRKNDNILSLFEDKLVLFMMSQFSKSLFFMEFCLLLLKVNITKCMLYVTLSGQKQILATLMLFGIMIIIP